MKLSALHPICIPLGSVLCVLLLTTCESPTQTAESDLAPQFVKKDGKGKPPKPPPDPSSTYTLTDLGPGVGGDISNSGIVVGSLDGEATLWTVEGDPPVALGKFGESWSWAGNINREGTRAVGDAGVDGQQQAVLWKLDQPGKPGTVLHGLDGTGGNASGVNDSGQAVGQSHDDTSFFGKAVLWEEDGNAVELPMDLLTVLEDGEVLIREGVGGWAIGINNSGHIVGKIFFDYPLRSRAVLWIVTYDEDGKAVIDVIDLTEDSDETGDNQAVAVTEVSSPSEEIQIAGFSSVGGERFSTIWTVDPTEDFNVSVDHTIGYDGNPTAINNSDEVALSSAKVWDIETDLVESLPTLSGNCSAAARGMNEAGTVVGRSGIKVKGRCTNHTVIWTKN